MKLKRILAFRQLYSFLFLAALLLNLAACARPLDSSNKSEDDGTAEDDLIESTIDLSGKTIGYCTPTLNAPYYQALMQSIKETTEKNGMTFLSADGQDDINKQVAAVEDLITKGVDALLLNPKDHSV